MEALEQDYEDYRQSRLSARTFVRTLGPWRVETAAEGDTLLLLIVNDAERVVLRFVYDSLFERSRDVEMLKRVPPDGETQAGVAARLRRPPSAPAASNAKPMPGPDARKPPTP